MDIDEIEDLQDDMADIMDQANEVQESLGRSYGVGQDIDEGKYIYMHTYVYVCARMYVYVSFTAKILQKFSI